MSKLYTCPKCISPNVYAGFNVVNRQFRILEIFAGCNDCKIRFVSTRMAQ